MTYQLRTLVLGFVCLALVLSQTPPLSAYLEGRLITDTWSSSPTGYSSRRIVVRDSSGSIFTVLSFSVNQDNAAPYYLRVARYEPLIDTWTFIADPGITPVDINKSASLAIDSTGQLHLSWHAWASSVTGHVNYQRYNGTSWSTPEQVSSTQVSGGRTTVIAVDNLDNIHLAWQGESGDTYYRKKTGSSWGAIESVGSIGAQTSLAIDYNNDVHIVGGYSGAYLQYIKKTGAAWGAIETIDSTGSPRHAAIAVDSLNQPHVAWCGDGYAAGWKIFYSVRLGGTWQTRMQLSPSGVDCHDSGLVIDASNQVFVMYHKVINASNEEYQLYCRRNSGSGWDAELALTDIADKARSAALRWSSSPLSNRVADENDLDFIWTQRQTMNPIDPYPAYHHHGIHSIPVTPTATPTGPTRTPTPSPTVTPTLSTYLIEVTSQSGLASQDGFRVAIADVNGDDYPDLLLHETMNEASSNPADVLNHQKLYLNVPGSTPGTRQFIDYTIPSGIQVNRQGTPEGRHSSLAAFADVDNDGDLDLFLGLYYHRLETYTDWGDRNDLFLNDGEGRFTLAPDLTFFNAGLINTSGATFLDYNLDGNIDLFLGTWFLDYAGDVFSQDRLYRGNGDGTFTELTIQAGINVLQPSYAVTMDDWNNDGYCDLYAANYCRGPGSHYRNNGNGTFTQVGTSSGYSQFTRCSWGCMPRDFDNDGDSDLFEVFVHGSETGQRSGILINTSSFYTWDFGRVVGRGAEDPDPSHHGDHYGSWFDVDNDGLADFVITECGYSNNRIYFFKHESNHYLNADTPQSGLNVVNATGYPPHNASPFDYDLDGDEDLLVGYAGDVPVALMENVVGTLNHWITIKLVGQGIPGKSNKAAIGAKVVVTAGGITYTRTVNAGNGHFAPQVPLALTFGLGLATMVDSIAVHWPNSSLDTQTLTAVPADQFITIVEGEPGPSAIPTMNVVGLFALVIGVSLALLGTTLRRKPSGL